MNLQEISALEMAAKIKQRELSVKEAVEAVAESVEAREPAYHCYAHFDKESALRQAETVQKGIDDGTLTSPLAGVPVAVKDNICTKGLETTCSSKMLTGFRPPYNAAVIEKMNGAGLVTLGKLNMDEFAMGSTTETSAYGPTNNPWDVTRVPGGSSGGAAAAVAAGEAVAALGSDTGGSIRQPCSFCGVTGLKPTYGAVSRYGLIAYASSLDQIGPIGRTVEDVAALFSVISGKDPKDGTSMPSEPFDLEEIRKLDVKGKKIGIPADYFGDGIAEDVANNVKAAAEVLKSLGAQVETFSMPIVKYAVPTYYIIACAEACSNLSRYDGIKYGYRTDAELEGLRELYFKSRSEGFGMEVKKRIMLGNFVLSSGYYDAYYKKALQAKALIREDFDKAFESYDLLLGPVAPTTALKQGESLTDPLKMYLGDIYTVMINLAGLPSLALPCGFDRDGLPVGMQLIGRPLEEKIILQAGYAYQQSTEYHKQAPAFKQ